MIVDTSVVIAILFGEAQGRAFARTILAQGPAAMSAVAKLEAGMVALGRAGDAAATRLDTILRELNISVVPFDDAQADIARAAFARYGKGRHPAALDFGDCAVYALAIAEAQPLLFQGTDFGLTDVEVATIEAEPT